jgi:hypothetical protein
MWRCNGCSTLIITALAARLLTLSPAQRIATTRRSSRMQQQGRFCVRAHGLQVMPHVLQRFLVPSAVQSMFASRLCTKHEMHQCMLVQAWRVVLMHRSSGSYAAAMQHLAQHCCHGTAVTLLK